MVPPAGARQSSLIHSRRLLRDPEEFSNVATGLTLDVEYQRGGSRPTRVEHFITPRWALDFGDVAVGTRTRGSIDSGWASLCINLGPEISRWNGCDGPPGSLSLLPPGGEVDGRTAAGFSYLTVAVPPEEWQAFLAAASATSCGPGGLSVFALPPPCWKLLRERISAGRAALHAGVAASVPDEGTLRSGESLAEACFLAVCDLAAGPCRARDSLRNRWRLARRADEWMRARLDQSIRMTDLCLAMRVSRREIEYAFRTTFEQSPRRHLELLRLHAARRDLLTAKADGRTVVRVAHDCGITHLGRFAASYQSLFGEKPSDTLTGHARL